MGDWASDLPVPLMAAVIFLGAYAAAALVHLVVTRLATGERARAFKALSPGMLPPLGILFGLLVGFMAAQVWSDFERAKLAVATEASALRAVVLLSESFPEEPRARLRALINMHIDETLNQEWPQMRQQQETLRDLPVTLIEALKTTFDLAPGNASQTLAQRETVTALETALEARRQRIILSHSTVTPLKWAALLLQGMCTLIAIAIVHSDNRLASRIALTIFSTGIALSVLLIAAYDRPFSGGVTVGPDLLRQVIVGEPASRPP